MYKSKHYWTSIIALICLLILGTQNAFAKSRSSSSRSSSSFSSSSKSSFSSSPSSSVSKSSPASSTGMYGSSKSTFTTSGSPTPPTSNTKPNTVMYGNTTTKSTFSNSVGTTLKPTDAPKITYIKSPNTSTTQIKDSLKSYKVEKSKYVFTTSTPPVTVRSPIPTSNRSWSSYDEYKSNQRRYYTQRNWDPPNYTYQTYPSFGGFSNQWLFFMLGNMTSDFFYHRKDDPGVKTFMAEAERLAKDNKDLQSQLDKVKADMEDMKKENKEVQKDYFPKDQDPDVATELEMDEDEESNVGMILIIFTLVLVAGGTIFLIKKS